MILGTNVTPLTTPTGVKKIEGQNGTWHNLSVALPDEVLAGLDFVDTAILGTLAKSSEALFGMEMTVGQLLKANTTYRWSIERRTLTWSRCSAARLLKSVL